MARSRVNTVPKLSKAEAKARLKENIVRFIAERTAEGLPPKDIAPMVEREFRLDFDVAKVRDYKYRYVTDAIVDEARERLAKGTITTSADGRPEKTPVAMNFYALQARDPEAVLERIAEVFFMATDHRLVVQAGNMIVDLCGHDLKDLAKKQNEERLLAYAEHCVQKAMAASGDDRPTAIRKLIAETPEFAALAEKLKQT